MGLLTDLRAWVFGPPQPAPAAAPDLIEERGPPPVETVPQSAAASLSGGAGMPASPATKENQAGTKENQAPPPPSAPASAPAPAGGIGGGKSGGSETSSGGSALKAMIATAIHAVSPNADTDLWDDPVEAACLRFGATSPRCVAALAAQCGHESLNYTRTAEEMDYRTTDRLRKVFKSTFPAKADPARYLRKPYELAELVYAFPGNRLGNRVGVGDGWMFRGGGLIQLTGRVNYEPCARDLGMTAEALASYARTPAGAAMTAVWYMAKRGLVAAAEAGNFERVALLTAGYSKMTPELDSTISYSSDRKPRWDRARKALGV